MTTTPVPVALFRVTSWVKEFDCHEDVTVSWFVDRRENQLFGPGGLLGVNYADATIGGEPNIYSRAALEELFTAEEASLLKSWLDTNRFGHETCIECASLPIDADIMGFGAVAYGMRGNPGCISFTHCDLPFRVCGHYDLRFHRAIHDCKDHDGVEEIIKF